MKKTPNTSQLGTGTPTPPVDKGNIITPMDLQTATKILERALKAPSSRTANAIKTNIREIESLARDSRSGQLRLLLSKVHALGLSGAPMYELAYAYVLATWAGFNGSFDATFELAEEQQYWEATLTAKQQDRAAELLPSILAEGEPPKHAQGNPFNGSWWGYGDDPIPDHPGSPEFRQAFDKWLAEMRIKPRPDPSLMESPWESAWKKFKWSDSWETEIVVCRRCGWQGAIEVDWDEEFVTPYGAIDFLCPRCPRVVHLASITLASTEEAREHWDELSAEEQSFYTKRIEREAQRIEREAKATHDFLESLPDIADDPLILVWDVEFEWQGRCANATDTTIKHEGQVIWRERAYYECVDRFNEVVAVLRQKYGDRLKALIPTGRSMTYLYGDIISPSGQATDISMSFPILGIKALAAAGDQDALNQLRYQQEFAFHHLERADQLPDVSADPFVLSWDLAESPPRLSVPDPHNSLHIGWDKVSRDGFLYVTLRHDGHELWREAATTESSRDANEEFRFALVERFAELTAIAKSKYGPPLKDIVPSWRSKAYFGGLVWKELDRIRGRDFPDSGNEAFSRLRQIAAEYPDVRQMGDEILNSSMSQPVTTGSAHTSCLSVAWPPFAKKLAAVLEKLEEDQFLILSIKRSYRFVQFASQGAFGMRVETTSNSFMAKPEQLNERQISALIDIGWHAPTGTPVGSTPENDPDGSPNFFVDYESPVPFEAIANMAVRTLSEILRVPHPGFLQYQAIDDAGGEWEAIELPELGLKLEKSTPKVDSQEDLSQLLLTTLKETSGISDLSFDDDGDIGIRHGSALTFVRLIDDPLYVRIFSPILRDVEESPEIYARLNDMNASETLMRFIFKNGVIYGVADVVAVPFVGAQVAQTFVRFCAVVDGMDSLLQSEFGGRTAFVESMPSSMRH